MKDEGGRARYSLADIGPVLVVVLNNLFTALRFTEFEENQCVMKCIMRILGVADITQEVVGPSIAGLSAGLNEACKKPKESVLQPLPV